MVLDFYYTAGSAPCRAILMTAKAIGVELNLKETNLMAGEHMTPEFLAINPQHTVPTLVDDGFALWESRAIMVYLVEKYGKTSSLYPSDPKARAVVNQRLYFDMGTLYDRFGAYFYPQIFAKAPADPEKLTKLEEALGYLNGFLEGQKYAAGDNLTLADLSLAASMSTIALAVTDLSKYPNIVAWLERCKATIPGYDLNEAGVAEFKAKFIK